MKFIKITIYTILTLLFISCGDNTEIPLKDVDHVKINEPTLSMYSTDIANFTATVYYDDATSADATTAVNWVSSDDDIAAVINGEVIAGNANGGDANISITYQDLTAGPSSISITALTSFTISNADINTTGDHILEAKGDFSDGTTGKVIIKNIVWLADNGSVITVTDDIATITVIAGDTNVTATMFSDTNSSSPIAPQSIVYTVN